MKLYTNSAEEHADSIFRVQVRSVGKLMHYMGYCEGSGQEIIESKWKVTQSLNSLVSVLVKFQCVFHLKEKM